MYFYAIEIQITNNEVKYADAHFVVYKFELAQVHTRRFDTLFLFYKFS